MINWLYLYKLVSLLKPSLIYIKLYALKIYIFTALYFHVYVALSDPPV